MEAAFFRKSKSFLVFCIVVAWIFFYAALSSNDGSPVSVELSSPPPASPRESREAVGRAVSTELPDPVFVEAERNGNGGEIDFLEREYETFNIPVLSIASLSKILLEDLNFVVEAPDSARSLELKALERGGRPLGEILVGLLSPHDHVFFRQGKTLRIVACQYKRRSRRTENDKEEFQSCSLETVIRVKWAEPVDLWIDSFTPLKIRFAVQPLFEEPEVRQVVLTIEGRRDRRPWFRHVLDAPLDRPVRMETRGSEWVWLTVKPSNLDESEIALEVKFYHESTFTLP